MKLSQSFNKEKTIINNNALYFLLKLLHFFSYIVKI